MEIEALPLDELPDGSMRLVPANGHTVGLYHCGGQLHAIEDRCTHDDGPLCEGDFDADEGVAICPRHGANIDIRTGRPRTLPAVEPVATYPVRVEDGIVKLEVS